MPTSYDAFLSAAANDRRDAFTAAGAQLGASASNIEKDFWVCWTLNALFNGIPADGPRLLFKGGTSLSKGFGLISRFSEDIDVTVFRDDLVEGASIDALTALSGKQRKAKIEQIKAACQLHIDGKLRTQLETLLYAALDMAGIARTGCRIELDADDPDKQTLLVWYPAVTTDGIAYIRPAVKIESGAKSALDPHTPLKITPYVAAQLDDLDLSVANVTTVDAERTFWDKVVILHGQRRWYERRGALRGGGQRVSRHYYDIHRLMQDGVSAKALANAALGENCITHARMFFNSADLDLASAKRGSFALAPTDAMKEPLKADYVAMAGMIFGEAPDLDAVLASVTNLQEQLNILAQDAG
ncbi:MAG: nucleotidyl transferase AbiEii/AbiGii toxin family protein [Hyphomonadaceae bacterium]|nr:nucleotidyl transferase AbiEii/AbiGii toxin family protein [Hyphomonadaceae bacterium]